MMEFIRRLRPYTESIGHAYSVTRSISGPRRRLALLTLCSHGWLLVSDGIADQSRHGSRLVSPRGPVYRVTAAGRILRL